MQKLHKYLQSIPAGPISDTTELETLLANTWDKFDGSDAESMEGLKLLGRIEKVEWNSPTLSFIIERHGATVLSSSRATLQMWEVNVKNMSATWRHAGHKQLTPMQPRLDVKTIAKEIAQLIIKHRQDEQLKWNKDGTVRIEIGKILPENSAVPQTLADRRKRFRKAVDNLLNNAGWQKVRANVYAPPTT